MTSSPLPDSLSESDLDAAAAAAGQKILNSQSNDNSNNPLIPEQRPLDLMYSHPNGGNLFCGNQNAAASLELLQQNAITVIVNCQDVLSTVRKRRFCENSKKKNHGRISLKATRGFLIIDFQLVLLVTRLVLDFLKIAFQHLAFVDQHKPTLSFLPLSK